MIFGRSLGAAAALFAAPEFGDQVGSYFLDRILIFHLDHGSRVEVVRILHSARDMLSLLQHEPGP